METNENEGKEKKQVCETVQLLITEVVCGYRRLIVGKTLVLKSEASPILNFTFTEVF